MILDTIDNGGWIANLSRGRIEELKASFKGKGKKKNINHHNNNNDNIN